MFIFRTPGLLEFKALTVHGLSAKPNSTNPIGRFGTGLKMALAGLARLEVPVTIFVGREEYALGTRALEFRGQEHKAVMLLHILSDEEEYEEEKEAYRRLDLNVTTQLGHHWEPWMLLRELISNTADENGDWLRTVDGVDPEPHIGADSTYIVVHNHPAMDSIPMSEYFLSEESFCFTEGPEAKLELHLTGASLISAKGFRVAPSEHAPAAYTYNWLGDIPLTEDRTLVNSHGFKMALISEIVKITAEDVIEDIITSKGPERYWDWNWSNVIAEMSDPFKETAFRLLAERKVLPRSLIVALRSVDLKRVEEIMAAIPRNWGEMPKFPRLQKSEEQTSIVTAVMDLQDQWKAEKKARMRWEQVAKALASQLWGADPKTPTPADEVEEDEDC